MRQTAPSSLSLSSVPYFPLAGRLCRRCISSRLLRPQLPRKERQWLILPLRWVVLRLDILLARIRRYRILLLLVLCILGHFWGCFHLLLLCRDEGSDFGGNERDLCKWFGFHIWHGCGIYWLFGYRRRIIRSRRVSRSPTPRRCWILWVHIQRRWHRQSQYRLLALYYECCDAYLSFLGSISSVWNARVTIWCIPVALGVDIGFRFVPSRWLRNLDCQAGVFGRWILLSYAN